MSEIHEEELVAIEWGTYLKMRCPYCEIINWVYMGRSDRIADPDREGMECWSCSKQSWLSSIIKDEFDYDSLEDAFIEKGRKEP